MSKRIEAIPIEEVQEVTLKPKKIRNRAPVEEDLEEDIEEDLEEEEVPKKKCRKQKTKKSSSTTEMMKMMQEQQRQFQEALQKMQREYIIANPKNDPDDICSESDCKSTSSTRTTQSIRDEDDYLTKGERLFILNQFTIPMLQHMRTNKGKYPTGSSKRELVASAVNLTKTKGDLIDFLLSAYN